MKTFGLIPILFLAAGLSCAQAAGSAGATAAQIEALRQKPDLRVLVTDSGLGGLSVCGGLEKKVLGRKSFQSVQIIFCNALPEADYGYNKIENPQRRAAVFSDALNGMVKRYAPDVVLIACNTLSVVYPDAECSRTLGIPVIGIVDLGVDMIAERLAKDPGASAVIFGTETTISANTHKAKCLAKGIAASRLVTQPCSELAGEIQNDPRGDPAKNLIEMYVDEAAARLPRGDGKVIAALCCTHYGYCTEMFSRAFAQAGRKDVEFVNPNERMAGLLFTPARERRFPAPAVTVKVVSRAALSPGEIRSISALLEKESPKTAAALRDYERRRDLFPFRSE